MAEIDYGEILNTVPSMRCPSCDHMQPMDVHPGHRRYVRCGHAFPLPAQRLFSDRRRSGASKRKKGIS